ncbi:MAG TPA: DEAD/DEAH box helicase [Pirellulales bacterium]|jgi:ATP-dependent RNA helicase RhlE|nr:DEAD/DEAH box helicase [Pirellulales bacterium]
MSFDVFGLAQPILRAVAAEGYTTPTPIQSQAIPHVIAGRDLLGCAQTGTGKTAAFALPILHRLLQSAPAPAAAHATGPTGHHAGQAGDSRKQGHASRSHSTRSRRKIRTLVLSPTRELAAQIGESFAAYGRHTGLHHTVVFGGVNQRPQVRDLQRGVDTLVATPGRLLDLINQGFIDLGTVEIFVLDEADRMLDMGFMPDVRRIISRLPQKRQTLFFSATMPPEIERLADAILHAPERVRIAPVKETAALVEHSVYFVPKAAKPQLLTALLSQSAITRALVFMRTKHSADRVARQLNRAGVGAEAIHGNKSQAARLRTLANFKSNRLRVLVATDLAARGIDVDGISHVFNFDLPHEPETYVHRIGRTGRAGATGSAVSFCAGDERKQLMHIQRLIGQRLTVEKSMPEGMAAIADSSQQQEPQDDDARGHDSANRSHQAASGEKHSAHSAGGGSHSNGRNGVYSGERRSGGYGGRSRASSGRGTSGRKPNGGHAGGYRGGKSHKRAKSAAGS